MTPLLCKGLLGAVVPVDAAGIAKSTVEVCTAVYFERLLFTFLLTIASSVQVVLAPIAVGMGLNKFFPKVVEKILPFAPVVGVVSTCLLVASAVAQVAEPILNAGISLQVSLLIRLECFFCDQYLNWYFYL